MKKLGKLTLGELKTEMDIVNEQQAKSLIGGISINVLIGGSGSGKDFFSSADYFTRGLSPQEYFDAMYMEAFGSYGSPSAMGSSSNYDVKNEEMAGGNYINVYDKTTGRLLYSEKIYN